mgnify:CR=1 FL=1|jgi:release factor glutamine methyltransferase
MTIQEALKKTQASLESGGLENAQNESRWIVSSVVEKSATDLHLAPDKRLTQAQADLLTLYTRRRGCREPLQHILGDVTFCDSTIEVTPDALIPRPETEWLVETLLAGLPERKNWTILDIGTGTGAIAITLAARLPSCSVIAMDLSSAALRLATRNVAQNDAADTIRLVQADLHTLPFPNDTFDLIISNPPYILSADIDHLETEVRDHEPLLALDGGADGLTCYRSLASLGSSCLKPGGAMALELPGHPPKAIAALFATGYTTPRISHDWTKKPRLLTVNRST